MSETSVPFTGAPAETVLPPPDATETAELDAAAGQPPEERRKALYAAAARWPRSPAVWAALADLDGPVVERYAFARVGYHRGLDGLRAAGWRGSGYVRARHPGNRGFLRCLDALRETAVEIGEEDEAARCRLFLRQLDPDWPIPSSPGE
jgi:hypothetical protein